MMDSTAAEVNMEPNETNNEEKKEQIGHDENPSAEEIYKQIQESFGETVAEAFQEQDATQLMVIKELLTRDAESGIFQKLKLNFGKAVQFKALFAHHLPPSTISNETPKTPAVKPTMGQLSKFDPALRRLYLAKRKQVGVLAAAHWNHTYPKFNSPERKAEIAKFAASINKECAVPAAGFNVDGIARHIQDFFNEQRRYKKRKSDKSTSSEETAGSDASPELPKCVKRSDSPSVLSVPHVDKNKDKDNEDNDLNSTPSTLSPVGSDNEEEWAMTLSQSSMPAKGAREIENTVDSEFSTKMAKAIVKSVCGKILTRDECVKLLKIKFSVQARNLTSLTPFQLLQVVSKKFVRSKYVTVPDNVDISQLKKEDIKVNKEIQL